MPARSTRSPVIFDPSLSTIHEGQEIVIAPKVCKGLDGFMISPDYGDELDCDSEEAMSILNGAPLTRFPSNLASPGTSWSDIMDDGACFSEDMSIYGRRIPGQVASRLREFEDFLTELESVPRIVVTPPLEDLHNKSFELWWEEDEDDSDSDDDSEACTKQEDRAPPMSVELYHELIAKSCALPAAFANEPVYAPLQVSNDLSPSPTSIRSKIVASLRQFVPRKPSVSAWLSSVSRTLRFTRPEMSVDLEAGHGGRTVDAWRFDTVNG